MFKNEEGFSLLELVVAVGVAGIIAIVALPTFAGLQDKATTTSAAYAASASAAEALANSTIGGVNGNTSNNSSYTGGSSSSSSSQFPVTSIFYGKASTAATPITNAFNKFGVWSGETRTAWLVDNGAMDQMLLLGIHTSRTWSTDKPYMIVYQNRSNVNNEYYFEYVDAYAAQIWMSTLNNWTYYSQAVTYDAVFDGVFVDYVAMTWQSQDYPTTSYMFSAWGGKALMLLDGPIGSSATRVYQLGL